MSCPLCFPIPERTWIETPDAIAFACDTPTADGHIVIAPRAHVATIYQLDAAGQRAVWKLVDEVRTRLTTGVLPNGVWVGMSAIVEVPGLEAHEHIHVVPGGPGEPPAIGGLQWAYVGSGEYAIR